MALLQLQDRRGPCQGYEQFPGAWDQWVVLCPVVILACNDWGGGFQALVVHPDLIGGRGERIREGKKKCGAVGQRAKDPL